MEILKIIDIFQSNIGKGPKISTEDYRRLMENLHKTPRDRIIEIQTKIVIFLLSCIDKKIVQPELGRKGHYGEYFEYYIGIQSNPLKLGDLLGMELKIWTGKTQLTLASLSFLKSLERITGLTEDQMLCAKQRLGTKCNSNQCCDSNHVFKMSEGIKYNKANSLGKLKYYITDDRQLIWQYFNGNKWENVHKANLNEYLAKFDQGFLLGLGKGNRTEGWFTLESLYYIPISSYDLIELFKQDKINYEVRYRKKKKHGIWDGKSFHNTGWGFRLKPSWVKKNWCIPEYKVTSSNDFLRLRKNISHSIYKENGPLDPFLDTKNNGL